MVFQNYALFPHMTVAGNVGYGLRTRRVATAEAARRVDAILDLTGLGSSRHAIRRSCRADSSSGWRWPARW